MPGRGAYWLAGCSLSGLFAAEVARQLAAAGESSLASSLLMRTTTAVIPACGAQLQLRLQFFGRRQRRYAIDTLAASRGRRRGGLRRIIGRRLARLAAWRRPPVRRPIGRSDGGSGRHQWYRCRSRLFFVLHREDGGQRASMWCARGHEPSRVDSPSRDVPGDHGSVMVDLTFGEDGIGGSALYGLPCAGRHEQDAPADALTAASERACRPELSRPRTRRRQASRPGGGDSGSRVCALAAGRLNHRRPPADSWGRCGTARPQALLDEGSWLTIAIDRRTGQLQGYGLVSRIHHLPQGEFVPAADSPLRTRDAITDDARFMYGYQIAVRPDRTLRRLAIGPAILAAGQLEGERRQISVVGCVMETPWCNRSSLAFLAAMHRKRIGTIHDPAGPALVGMPTTWACMVTWPLREPYAQR